MPRLLQQLLRYPSLPQAMATTFRSEGLRHGWNVEVMLWNRTGCGFLSEVYWNNYALALQELAQHQALFLGRCEYRIVCRQYWEDVVPAWRF